MPLILAPYTLGAQLPAAPTGTFGVGYYIRRKRYLAYIMMSILLAFLT